MRTGKQIEFQNIWYLLLLQVLIMKRQSLLRRTSLMI